MFLGVRIFIFLQKRQKIKTEQQTFQTFVDVFFVLLSISFYTPFAYIFLPTSTLLLHFFLFLKVIK